MIDMQLTFGSLFAGIGGIDLGLERAGMKCKWQVEIDNYATRVLKKNWPDVRRYRDIRELEEGILEPVDLICGGFPCQDISNAGKMAGITGEQSGLWKEYLRVIRMVRPRYVFVENVSALTQRGLDTVLADLATSGYNAEWDCIPAAAVGAPHRRDRIFIVAHTNSHGPSGEFREQSQKRCNSNKKLAFKSKSTDVADSPLNRCKQVPEGFIDTISPGRAQDLFQEKEKTLTNPYPERLEARIFQTATKKSLERYRCTIGKKQWQTEPGLGRVANGVPDRMDRIKCLGNAVVPQVAEFVAKEYILKNIKKSQNPA